MSAPSKKKADQRKSTRDGVMGHLLIFVTCQGTCEQDASHADCDRGPRQGLHTFETHLSLLLPPRKSTEGITCSLVCPSYFCFFRFFLQRIPKQVFSILSFPCRKRTSKGPLQSQGHNSINFLPPSRRLLPFYHFPPNVPNTYTHTNEQN
jgi:hypothetical protein